MKKYIPVMTTLPPAPHPETPLQLIQCGCSKSVCKPSRCKCNAIHYIVLICVAKSRRELMTFEQLFFIWIQTFLNIYLHLLRRSYMIIIIGECFRILRKKGFWLSHLNECPELLCGLSCDHRWSLTIPMKNRPCEKRILQGITISLGPVILRVV